MQAVWACSPVVSPQPCPSCPGPTPPALQGLRPCPLGLQALLPPLASPPLWQCGDTNVTVSVFIEEETKARQVK